MAAMERKRQKKIVLFLRTGLSVTDRRLYDSNAIANCAAKELLKLGLESFAYVSYPSHVAWCEAREKCFREIIELNGKSFSSARLPERNGPLHA